jgi:hypothetical protein
MSALRIILGDTTLLLPLDSIEAVLKTPPITPVPGTPPSLAGLFNHNGVVTAAVHPLDTRSTGRHAVIVRTSGYGRFALLCDWAEDVEAQPLGGGQLDLEQLGRSIVKAYAAITVTLPPATSRSTVIRLKPGV